jgi:hypothetical protein
VTVGGKLHWDSIVRDGLFLLLSLFINDSYRLIRGRKHLGHITAIPSPPLMNQVPIH